MHNSPPWWLLIEPSGGCKTLVRRAPLNLIVLLDEPKNSGLRA
jgi:hypothetical protein